jgi:hypothetical protein
MSSSSDYVTQATDNIHLMRENKGILIDAINETCVKVNTGRLKYVFLSGHQNAGQNRDIKIANK